MGVLIDTDVLVGLERGAWAVRLGRLVGDQERGISVVTVSELLHGVHRASGATAARRVAFVEGLLAQVEPLPITESVARVHARLGAEMAQAGEPIGAHDLWIGATAVTHGHSVLTGNTRDFARIPGLEVIDVHS